MPLNEKQKKELESLYEQGASYAFIAKQIGADSIKQVDNYVYKSGLSKEYAREVGARGGIGDEICMAPVGRLKKKECEWLASNFCKAHGKPFLAHWNCFLKENPEQERIGFFDIEASNLKANFGIILSWCILDDKTGKIYEDCVTKKDLPDILDEKVVRSCVETLKSFDKIVTFFGTRFDLPFIRTRAAYFGIPFPEYSQLRHKDAYYIIKSKFCLHSNRMENACRVLIGKTEKTPITPNYWIRALMGDKESLDYILEHNRGDVRDLQRLYHAVIPTVARRDTSI